MKPLSVLLFAGAALASLFSSACASDPVISEARIAKWEPSIAAFEKKDAESPPAEHPVVFVGSSSIRMWDLKATHPDLNAINRGFGGSIIADSLYFADRIILPYEPKAIVLYAGDNDIAAEMTPEEVAADFKKLSKLIETKLPGTPLLYIAIKPSVKRWDMWPDMKAANDLIAAYCAETADRYFVDIAPVMLGADGKPKAELFKSDGLHMVPEGYAAWKTVLDPILQKALSPKG